MRARPTLLAAVAAILMSLLAVVLGTGLLARTLGGPAGSTYATSATDTPLRLGRSLPPRHLTAAQRPDTPARASGEGTPRPVTPRPTPRPAPRRDTLRRATPPRTPETTTPAVPAPAPEPDPGTSHAPVTAASVPSATLRSVQVAPTDDGAVRLALLVRVQPTPSAPSADLVIPVTAAGAPADGALRVDLRFTPGPAGFGVQAAVAPAQTGDAPSPTASQSTAEDGTLRVVVPLDARGTLTPVEAEPAPFAQEPTVLDLPARGAGDPQRNTSGSTSSSSPSARGAAPSSTSTAPPGQYGCGGCAPASSSGS